MSDIAIHAVGLSKRYQIGQRESYKALRDVLTDAVRTPFRRASAIVHQPARDEDERQIADNAMIWALKDVSFEVQRGEIIGIIGRNGAGKSTLLKILSRITEPTEGRAEIHGRVGSLLEVGTGFHPELTGRENISLNGAILGMKKTEVARKFDEIVSFAEIQQFIDTPVKRYSSGMYMRLAFAVAAHLEPEILFVDEVLAVGDAAFQKKCLGRMDDVAKEGRTIVFVSHNMLAIQDLCQRVIWIEGGRVVAEGEPGTVVSSYLRGSYATMVEQVWDDSAAAPGNDDLRLHRACVRPASGSPGDPVTVHTPVTLEFEYWNFREGTYVHPSLYLYNEQGILLFNAGPSDATDWRGRYSPAGLFREICHVPGDLLNDGVHRVVLELAINQQTVFKHEDILVFDVRDTADIRDGWYGKWEGALRPILEWTTESVNVDTGPAPLSLDKRCGPSLMGGERGG
jgi:lipopolysaccharide transport system ATP-binding protein